MKNQNPKFYPLGWVLLHVHTGRWYMGTEGSNKKWVRHWSTEPTEAKRYKTWRGALAAQTILQQHGSDQTQIHCLWFDHGRIKAIPYDKEAQQLTSPEYQHELSRISS